MKILYVTTISSTINSFLVPHIEMLLDYNNTVDCACFVNKPLNENLKNKGVRIYDLPFQRTPFSIKNLVAFKMLIKLQMKNNYDVIHVHTPVASVFVRLMKIRFPKLKIIYTVHGYHFFQNSDKKSWVTFYPIEKLLAKLTDATITINNDDYLITKEKLKPKKTYFLNGVGLDLDIYTNLKEKEITLKRSEIEIKESDFLIIMIGELNKNKNQIQLIEALKLIDNKDVKALFLGVGNRLEYLKEKVVKDGLSERIKFLGYRKDVVELINISNIGVSMSYREGLPRNLMEIMSIGKPIIATNIRGSKDLIENFENGLLVEVNDVNATKEAILTLYNNKKLYYDICNKNKIKAENFSIRKINEELKDIYLDIDRNFLRK
ncbi:glycosyltransferase family 4 protein [Clostridium perfringens]|nr:glycosyltransferase family 4 protein [Clostridium perfringens]EJT5920940.1 glycosyltransferase family 4 protein [Clostridium perfringens]MDK0960218.1 glycosyltransferase family 4 protein [Clostridium perfringens]MDM0503863.1 glycosyltransferase family 4 protein [Clostridium perfringens]MDM0641734.1 glycosyltransferase family 4 protein [Clostridium perfringens]